MELGAEPTTTGEMVIQRRGLVTLLAAASLVAACADRATQAAREGQPPQGAVTAQAAHPPIGAKWRIRRVDSSNGSVQEFTLTAVSINYEGAPRYGVSDGADVSVLDPVTFNAIAELQNGKVTNTTTPDDGNYSWPLWVGKSWTSSLAYHDVIRGRSWDPILNFWRVTAYEDVTVPAGTFKAFKVESTPGTNEAAYRTYWYASDVKLMVKYIFQRTNNHYLGPGTVTTELLTVPR
jgi:hypothetical protein